MRRLTPWIVIALALTPFTADVARACPVCFSGTEENREAFFWTFVLLTTLPLATMGGIVWFLFRRAEQRTAREAAAAAADPA